MAALAAVDSYLRRNSVSVLVSDAIFVVVSASTPWLIWQTLSGWR